MPQLYKKMNLLWAFWLLLFLSVVGAYLISLRVFFLFLFLLIHSGLDCASVVAFIISILQLEELFRRRRRRWSSSSSNHCGFASF